MPTTRATGRDPTPAPSTQRPRSVKSRPSSAAKQSRKAQAQTRGQPRPAPRAPSHVGSRIDIKA